MGDKGGIFHGQHVKNGAGTVPSTTKATEALVTETVAVCVDTKHEAELKAQGLAKEGQGTKEV